MLHPFGPHTIQIQKYIIRTLLRSFYHPGQKHCWEPFIYPPASLLLSFYSFDQFILFALFTTLRHQHQQVAGEHSHFNSTWLVAQIENEQCFTHTDHAQPKYIIITPLFFLLPRKQALLGTFFHLFTGNIAALFLLLRPIHIVCTFYHVKTPAAPAHDRGH